LRTAASGRPGPVHLDIATDVLATAALPEARPSVPASGMFPTQRPRPGRRALVEVADLLRSAARPIVIAGGGTHLSGAGEVLTRFSEAFRVPVATTFNGKGIIAETTAFAVGVVGAKGHPAANALAGEADVVLWLGSKAGDKSTNYGRIPAAGAHVIQVDIDPHELGRILETDLQIAADATATLEDLHELLLSGGWRGAPRRWAAHAGSVLQTALTAGCGDQLHTLHLIAAIEERFSRKAVIVADASRACSWVGAFYRTGSAGRSVIAPRGSGSIGFALPATIGAAIARPECPVIGIGGDGGFGMSCHELETAVRLGTRFIFAILDNNSLGLLNQVSGVTLGQPDLCGDFAPTDWTAVAKAFGCRGETIDRPSQLPAALDAAVNSAKPTILDMKLPADEISPDFQMFTVRHTRSIPLVDEAVS
jgi:acetolactate synthase-1/2/3 large subunit